MPVILLLLWSRESTHCVTIYHHCTAATHTTAHTHTRLHTHTHTTHADAARDGRAAEACDAARHPREQVSVFHSYFMNHV